MTVLGRSAFHDTRLNFERSYLDTDWGMRTVAFAGYGCPLQADIPVHGMMQKLQEEYPERRDLLIKLLGVDLRKYHCFPINKVFLMMMMMMMMITC